jgi:hypothetical protein
MLLLTGPIEKGAGDGQLTYAQSLVTALKQAVSKSSPTARHKSSKSRGSGRRKGRDGVDTTSPEPHGSAAIAQKNAQRGSSWSFDSLLGEPANIIITVLAVLIVVLLWRGNGSGALVGAPHGGFKERTAAYEEMWRAQENEVWEWIEERVGLQEIRAPGVAAAKREKTPVREVKTKKSGGILDGMDGRELMEAIRVTKERLERLEGEVLSRNDKRKDEL